MESNNRLLVLALSFLMTLASYCHERDISDEELKVLNISNIKDMSVCREIHYDEISDCYLQNQSEVRQRDGFSVRYTLLNIICIDDNTLHVYEIDNGESTEILMCFDPYENTYPSTLLLYDCKRGQSPTTWFEIRGKKITVFQLYEQVDRELLNETTYEIVAGFKKVGSKITEKDLLQSI